MLKKLHFSERRASLNVLALEPKKSLEKINPAKYDLNCKQNVLLQIFSYIFMTSWRSPYSTTLPYPITESRPPRLIRQIFSRSKIWRKGEYFHFAGQTVTSWLESSRRHDDVTLLWGSRHCRLSSPPKIGDAKPIHVKGSQNAVTFLFKANYKSEGPSHKLNTTKKAGWQKLAGFRRTQRMSLIFRWVRIC